MKYSSSLSSNGIGPIAWRGREQKADVGHHQTRDFSGIFNSRSLSTTGLPTSSYRSARTEARVRLKSSESRPLSFRTRNNSSFNLSARSWKLEGVEMTEGDKSLWRMMMSERHSDWLMIMTGPCAAAELRASNNNGFRKFSKPGTNWI